MEDVEKIQLYSLLYVVKSKRKHVNLGSVDDPLDIYLRCALTLQESCARNGLRYAVLTNDKSCLGERLAKLKKESLPIVELEFSLDVPQGIPFYEAHFKLEALAALGSGELGSIVGLIDLDMIVLSPLTLPKVEGDWLGGYVLDNYTGALVQTDLRNAGMHGVAPGTWYGGEFLIGTARAFASLTSAIGRCWPNYLANIHLMSHVGDEAVVSAALNNMSSLPVKIMDLGKSMPPAIARWWSARTNHRQNRFVIFRWLRFSTCLQTKTSSPRWDRTIFYDQNSSRGTNGTYGVRNSYGMLQELSIGCEASHESMFRNSNRARDYIGP